MSILENLDTELLLLRLTASYGAPKTGTTYRYVEGSIKGVLRNVKHGGLDNRYSFPVLRGKRNPSSNVSVVREIYVRILCVLLLT